VALTEAGGFRVQDQLGYTGRPCLKTTTKSKNEKEELLGRWKGERKEVIRKSNGVRIIKAHYMHYRNAIIKPRTLYN
jgi:hypothetical protein